MPCPFFLRRTLIPRTKAFIQATAVLRHDGTNYVCLLACSFFLQAQKGNDAYTYASLAILYSPESREALLQHFSQALINASFTGSNPTVRVCALVPIIRVHAELYVIQSSDYERRPPAM